MRTSDDDIAVVFKLSELTKLYQSRLQQLGVYVKQRIHSTHLKERILCHVPDFKAYKEGRNVLLAFQKDIGPALKRACDFDDQSIIALAEASRIVREDMLEMKPSCFARKFDSDCQQMSAPQSLKTLVAMILGGTNIDAQKNHVIETQATLSILQLLQYNCTSKPPKSTTLSYHSKDREPPLPLYIGLLLHAKIRKRGLVDKCITWDF